jgi:alpha-L-fucosidase
MIINNSSVGALGAEGHPALDAVTFEQGLPSGRNSRRVAREMCETLASHWGIGANDFAHKSPADIIRTLVGCRANGANLLLNAGPEPSGRITPIDAATLDRVGDWLRASGFDRVLYDGRPVEGAEPGHGDRLLQAGGKLYYAADSLPIDEYHSLYKGPEDWDRRSISGPIPPVRSVHWLDNGESLSFTQNPEAGLLSFRSTSNPYGSQFVLRIAEVETEPQPQPDSKP